MKVGLFVNTQFPEGFNLTDRVLEMIAQVRQWNATGRGEQLRSRDLPMT